MKQTQFRLLIFASFLVGLAALLIGRLIDVQVIQGQQFAEQADDNRFFEVRIPADRGVFLDRYGQPLVWNTRVYGKKTSPSSLYSQIEPLEKDVALQLIATDGARVAQQVKRTYRYGSIFSHSLGYIGQVTAEDLEEREELSIHDVVGKEGLEKIYDEVLQGTDGSEVWEINALASRQRRVARQEPVVGTSITTSFDPYLSQVADFALSDAVKGTVLVVDTSNGQLLTLVNKPSYDPALFSKIEFDTELEQERRQALSALFTDENQPLFDRGVSGAYPPGSIFKLVTTLAGLESGALTANSTVIDEGFIQIDQYIYRNWYYRQYGAAEGEVGLKRAIARSNDIFFYKAAEWTGIDTLAEMARLFGFGEKTGIELRGERAGLIPTPDWKQEVFGEPWYLGNTYHVGIGQGDVLVTPVQVAQLIQSIGNNGKECQPTVLDEQQSECRLLGIREENLDLLLEGMLDACSPSGTGNAFFARNQQLRGEGASVDQDLQSGAVACKTGTAEFGPANEQGLRNTHGWWVGIVEPQFSRGEDSDATVSEQLTPEESDAEPEIDLANLRNEWLKNGAADSFPRRIGIVVLVESDEDSPFRGGTRDATPVGKAILDWIEGRGAGFEGPVSVAETAVSADTAGAGLAE